MFSALERISNVFIILSLMSLAGSIFLFILLHDNSPLINTETPFFVATIFVAVVIPIIFISLSIAMRMIAKELSAKMNALYTRIGEIEQFVEKHY